MNKTKNNIAILVVYYGIWPKWIDYFLYSASKNISIDFIIISDSNPSVHKYTNIIYYKQSLDELCSLIKSKLDVQIAISNAYKLCDYKPTYGILFENYLVSYDYWGYCDIDILLSSDLHNRIKAEIEKNDIFLGYTDFASGPFAIYRNCIEVNTIYMEVADYKEILSSKACKGMDEHIIKSENMGFSVKKVFYLLLFLLKNPLVIFNYEKMKFRFQWYYKRKNIDLPVDISEVLYLVQEKKRFKVCFYPLITNDTDFILEGFNNWVVSYKNGRLLNNNNELLIFQFRVTKNHKNFSCDIQNNLNHINLVIKPDGIYIIDE